MARSVFFDARISASGQRERCGWPDERDLDARPTPRRDVAAANRPEGATVQSAQSGNWGMSTSLVDRGHFLGGIVARTEFATGTPRPPRLLVREVGPLTVIALVIAYGALWVVARPSDVPGLSYVGQFLGAESILLLSIALVLISSLPWVEIWFDGIDRAAIWHRRVAMLGLLLLLPHILMSARAPGHSGPGGALGAIGLLGLAGLVAWAVLPRWQMLVPRSLRGLVVAARDAPGIRQVRQIFGGYDRWRSLHRTTGLFVAAGFVHGLLDGTPFDGAPILRWTFLVVGGIGLAFYVYRELLARYFLSLHDYQVAEVREIDRDLVEISLRPLGRPMRFVPGQFAMIYLEGKDGWHRHPFTIASAPHEGVVRVTVKALGDYTSRLSEVVEEGMPAVIGGPHGRFSHTRGSDHQVWIAGGVGVAPFLSWLRSLDQHPTRCVDFFYTNDGVAPFADEIIAITAEHPGLRTHMIDTNVDGRLTTEQVLQAAGGDPSRLSVFMCGPARMLQAFQSGLHSAGVPNRHIHREYFDWR
jgi:predicted ferric reductase